MKRWTLLSVMALTAGIATLAVRVAGQESTPDGAVRNDEARCTERTLKGRYGVTITGLRPAAGGLEQFVGVSMQTYDGKGHFTQMDNTHGPSGAKTDQPGWGTYTVNPDCSGTKTLWLEGVPVPIENRFVIVDKGAEIRLAVIAPSPFVVSAAGRRVF
jgi:hypothetical protein